MHRRPAGVCVREPVVSPGIYTGFGEAFQALLAGGQRGHRGRPNFGP